MAGGEPYFVVCHGTLAVMSLPDAKALRIRMPDSMQVGGSCR